MGTNLILHQTFSWVFEVTPASLDHPLWCEPHLHKGWHRILGLEPCRKLGKLMKKGELESGWNSSLGISLETSISQAVELQLRWFQNDVKVHVLNFNLGLRITNFGWLERKEWQGDKSG